MLNAAFTRGAPQQGMSPSASAPADSYEQGLALGRAGRHAEAITRFEAALARYRSGDIAQARSIWRECGGMAPEDRPTRVFLERCETFSAHSPPESWDGVWTLSEK